MTRFRDIYKKCPDNRPCFAAMVRGTERFCGILRDTDYKDGQCPYCKRRITDRTDKP
jgi:hypothetical protein